MSAIKLLQSFSIMCNIMNGFSFLSRDVCISVEAVNRAFSLASDGLQLAKSPFKNDIGTDELGEVILETTRLLAEE